jgi:SAM-dependent methyltransferase
VAESTGLPIDCLKIADVGSGSGKLTAALVACGAMPVAIEPSQPMRDACARVCPGVPQLDGTATALPLDSNSQDAVFVGQAFHWFANLSALAELRRVLRPGGRLLLVWNGEAEPLIPWALALRHLLAPLEATVPNYRGGAWRHVWATPEAAEWFRVLPERRTRRVTLVTRQQCWERIVSKSYVASLDGAAQERLRVQVDAILLAPFAGLAPDAAIECPLDTLVFAAAKQ